MNIYITTGTYGFLKKIQEKHSDKGIVLMQGVQESILVHETEGESLFQVPRKYEVINGKGSLHSGFAAILHAPAREEGRPVFEYQLKERARKLEAESGIRAHRLLRPFKSDTYLFITVWDTSEDFSASSFSEMDLHEIAGENQNVLANPAFITEYSIMNDKD